MKLPTTALLPLMAALLAACSQGGADEPASAPDSGTAPTPAQAPLAFAPARSSAAASRGLLADFATDFGVIAWKGDGASREYVMRHADERPYQVRLIDDGDGGSSWLYDIVSLDGTQQYLRFWDLSAPSYTFSAYAPYSVYDASSGSWVEATDFNGVEIAADGTVTVRDVKGNVTARPSTRWATALWQRTASPLADTDLLAPAAATPALSALTDVVPLVFHSITSEVQFRAYNHSGTAITLNSVRVEMVTGNLDSTPTTVYTLGDWNGAGWQNLSSPESLLFEGYNLGVTGADKASATTLGALTELPQEMAGRWMKVTVVIGANTLTGFFQLPLLGEGTSDPYAWRADKVHVYTFALSESQEIILMDIDMASFVWDEGNYVELDGDDALTNW